MDKQTKRFNQLLEDYAIALHISDQLHDSGLIKNKIKIRDEKMFTSNLVSAIAHEMNVARRRVQSIIKSPYDAQPIAEAYFADLATNGPDWPNADLEDLFTEYYHTAKEEAERRQQCGY